MLTTRPGARRAQPTRRLLELWDYVARFWADRAISHRTTARLGSHALVVALCLGVAYLGRRDPGPRQYPGPDAATLVSSPRAALAEYAPDGNGVLVARLGPDPTAIAGPGADSPSSLERFSFLSVLRDVPLTMSTIVNGGATSGAAAGLAPISYHVAPGDSVWSIAHDFGVSPESIATANGLDSSGALSVGQKLLVPPIPGFLYVVREGDTLGNIADHYQTTPDSIVRANGLANANSLQIGRTLVVPGDPSGMPAAAPLPSAQSPTVAAPVSARAPRTYVVKEGDSVSGIGAALGVPDDSIIAANALGAPYLLQPGQKLTIPTPEIAASVAPTATPAKPRSDQTYIIQPGDTLVRIGALFGVNPSALASRNGISDPSRIQPGQRLVLAVAWATPTSAPATATPTPAPTATPLPSPTPRPALAAPRTFTRRTVAARENPAPVKPRDANTGWSIVAIASKYLGYRYVWGGTSPATGFDCSGFVWYVYSAAGLPIPRELSAQIESGASISRADLQAGDIVYFVNTYKPGLSHDGIYLGGGRFISAADYGIGVIVSSLSDRYWSAHFAGAVRPG